MDAWGILMQWPGVTDLATAWDWGSSTTQRPPIAWLCTPWSVDPIMPCSSVRQPSLRTRHCWSTFWSAGRRLWPILETCWAVPSWSRGARSWQRRRDFFWGRRGSRLWASQIWGNRAPICQLSGYRQARVLSLATCNAFDGYRLRSDFWPSNYCWSQSAWSASSCQCSQARLLAASSERAGWESRELSFHRKGVSAFLGQGRWPAAAAGGSCSSLAFCGVSSWGSFAPSPFRAASLGRTSQIDAGVPPHCLSWSHRSRQMHRHWCHRPSCHSRQIGYSWCHRMNLSLCRLTISAFEKACRLAWQRSTT